MVERKCEIIVWGGAKGGDGGPFSIRSYLKYMVKDKVWGDSIFIGLVASMWECRISVLRADSGKVVNYRHELPLGMCDVGLLFNCRLHSGHYSALWRMDGNFVKTEKVKKSIGFKDDVDETELESLYGSGGEGVKGDEVVVKKERLDQLIKKELMFGQMCKVIEAGGAMPKRRRVSSTEKEGEIEIDEKEVAQDIQVVHKGDTVCEECGEDYKSTTALNGHVMKYHKGKFRYECTICGKGYMVSESLKRHVKEHSGEKVFKRCIRPDCKSTFSSEKSRRHVKLFHGEGSDILKFECDFCKNKFLTLDNKKQHQVRCKQNPEKKHFSCDICHRGTFYLPKELMRHKKENHNW